MNLEVTILVQGLRCKTFLNCKIADTDATQTILSMRSRDIRELNSSTRFRKMTILLNYQKMELLLEMTISQLISISYITKSLLSNQTLPTNQSSLILHRKQYHHSLISNVLFFETPTS